MKNKEDVLRRLPAVNSILAWPEIRDCVEEHGRPLVVTAVRDSLAKFRLSVEKGNVLPDAETLVQEIKRNLSVSGSRSLRKVINATGVVIHTNLGRAPLGRQFLEESMDILSGYNNLEFDLESGQRGERSVHAAGLLKHLTGAEDIVIVNNNAAAVMFVLRCFARGKEVPVSRGELIEIGGSFRIPDIMAASDCKMVEVGTTNKTRLSDYAKAISKKTGILFKAHKSNYIIKGFTEEVTLTELCKLGRSAGIPVLYDLGSGLLKRPGNHFFNDEPDVSEALAEGADLVCFSGDKLLGGPQAGIIAGKKEYIARLKKDPMMRALRVCKMTLCMLESACLSYLNDESLYHKNSIFKIMNRKPEEIRSDAEALAATLKGQGLQAEVVKAEGQCGGGTLPDAVIESYAVKISIPLANRQRSRYAENMQIHMQHHSKPVLPVLIKGDVHINMLCVFPDEQETLVSTIVDAHKACMTEK
jgi:L-seryl-tRNA(Ser) seleniumtransferase